MGRTPITLWICSLLLLIGCRDVTVIGIERQGQPTSTESESSSESGSSSDSEPATASESIDGTESGTDSTVPTDSDSDTGTDTGQAAVCGVPTAFSWTSSQPLFFPPAGYAEIKDPTVVLFDGNVHMYATVISDNLSLARATFPSWDQAATAPLQLISENSNFTGYMPAPQLFFFAPQQLWYLIYQTQEPTYSTSPVPDDITQWTAATKFMPMPSLLTENDAMGIDYWIICDETTCYMFFTGSNGTLYRAKTPKSDFPNGFEGTTEIVMSDAQFNLFDACNVYKIAGTNQYLLLVSAIGANGRYFRSWTSDRLDGSWMPLADTEDNAFASVKNVTGAEWSTFGISHGEMLRTNPDETMTINTCSMQYLFSAPFRDEATQSEGHVLGLLTDGIPRQ